MFSIDGNLGRGGGGLTIRAADRGVLVGANTAAGPHPKFEATLLWHELIAGVPLHDGGSSTVGLARVTIRGQGAAVTSGADRIALLRAHAPHRGGWEGGGPNGQQPEQKSASHRLREVGRGSRTIPPKFVSKCKSAKLQSDVRYLGALQ